MRQIGSSLLRAGVGRLLFFAALVLFYGGVAVAEPVTVRAAAHDDFGRIVFDWPDSVSYSAEIQNGILLVLFDRPIETDYTNTTRVLSRYVGSAQADTISVAFPLKGNFRLNTFVTGTSVVIDLLGAAATPSPSTSAVPSVNVRVGEHETFSRIVFDWTAQVGYRVNEGAGTITVDFDGNAKLNLAGLKPRPARHVTALRTEITDQGSRAILDVPAGSTVRHFRAGTKVVMDISPPGNTEQTASAANPVETTPAPAPAAPVTVDTAVIPAPASETVIVANSEPPAPVPAINMADASPASDMSEGPVSLLPPGDEALAPSSPEGAATAPSPKVTETVELRFDWSGPVAAAVFRRGENLWAVFDSSQEIDVAALKAKGGNIFHDIQQMPNERATVLRFTTVSGINPEIKRDGFSWILGFGIQALEPTTPIEANAQPNSPLGARIFLPVAEPSRAIAIRDPDVGDNLVVVPVIPLGYGMLYNYIYPQMRFIATAQGIVVQPLIDTLRVRSLRQGIEVTSTEIMQISPVSVEEQASIRVETKETFLKPLTRIFDLEKWKRGDLQNFVTNKQRLQNVIARASGPERETARMNLARFYFANSFEVEALSILELVEADRPEIAGEMEFRAMRGAINVLMGRYEEARGDLQHDSLSGNDEGTFWRAALGAYEGDLVGAAKDLLRTGAITRPYPRPLKMPLGTLVAEAAIEVGDITQAAHYLEILSADEPSEGQQSQLDFVDGRLKELSGDFQGAIGAWEGVADGTHRPSRAKAILARAELLLKLDKYTNLQVIDDMERLRFSWRGGDFEFNLLRHIGNLYLEEKSYREALRAYRQAATYFRDHELAPEVTAAMSDLFNWLYLKGGASELSPVTAIALYDEFRELTPAGADGDEMIRRLADRLVEVDLLDRAARLLATQVDFRLKDEEKVRVGARLALVYILNQRYGDALETLDKTELPGIGEELAVQRRHLKARALIGQNKGQEILPLLEEDESNDADLLRAEVYWQAQDWKNAGNTLRKILRNSGARAAAPLDDRQAGYVIDLAIAFTLGGDERSLVRLRQDYGLAMDSGTYKDAFRLIAAPESYGLIDYRTIASRVKVVENFQAFMTDYRQMVKTGKLSGIN